MAEITETPVEHARDVLDRYYRHGITQNAVDVDADARELVTDLEHLIERYARAATPSSAVRVIIDRDGEQWIELATDRWWALPAIDGTPSIIGPDEVYGPGRSRESVDRSVGPLRESTLVEAPLATTDAGAASAALTQLVDEIGAEVGVAPGQPVLVLSQVREWMKAGRDANVELERLRATATAVPTSEQDAERIDAVLLALDEVRWTPDDEVASVTVRGEDSSTSYDRQNFARLLAGLPPRAVVGGEVEDVFGLAHAPAGTTLAAQDGERGLVTRTVHDGPGEPGHTSYGVTWASGRTGDRGSDSPWPARVLEVPTGGAR